jgi:hypothetical protein
MVKIVIPGGSGQVGHLLARHFRGHDVVVLSRSGNAPPGARGVVWDGRTAGPWAAEIEGAAAVINLAGRSVDCRYNAANRRQIMDSRVDSTRAVGEAIAAAASPPPVWLQASTATIYAHRFDAPNDERTGRIGAGFSVDVARAWEAAALESPGAAATRLVLLRSAMTMSPDRGGIFDVLLRLVRLGVGGAAAGGRQYVSWIHEADFARAVDWLIEREDIAGPVNLTAPEPLPHAQFMRALREAWGIPFGLPANRLMLEAGALAMRTETELVLKSRRVAPGILLEEGFEFAFPEWAPAARDLVQKRASADGGSSPRWANAWGVATRPRGVRCRKPRWSR